MTFTYDYPHPAVTADVVTFTIREDALSVLLVKRGRAPFRGKWALPGGFVDLDESLEDGACRELEEETGMSGVYLEQLYTFGDPDRDPRERVITVAYMALVPAEAVRIRAGSDAEKTRWFAMSNLPELAFDHRVIVETAHGRLVDKLDHTTIALQLMPRDFTLSELQGVYERVRGEELDKRNFRKRILRQGIVTETGEERRSGAHRPAKLYRPVHPDRVDVLRSGESRY